MVEVEVVEEVVGWFHLILYLVHREVGKGYGVEVQVYGGYTVCNKEQRSTRDLVKEREEVWSL